jgi:hypothetical protein
MKINTSLFELRAQPNLRLTALHFVFLFPLLFRIDGKLFAQSDEFLIAVFPVLEL